MAENDRGNGGKRVRVHREPLLVRVVQGRSNQR